VTLFAPDQAFEVENVDLCFGLVIKIRPTIVGHEQ
jgi:hypothetical protein